MSNGIYTISKPQNEPVGGYLPGSKEKAALKRELARMAATPREIPLIIGGKEVRTGNIGTCVMPHNHQHVLGTYHMAGETETRQAIEAALAAGRQWADTPWHQRLAVFLKAAELLAKKWRPVLTAATILGQSKTVMEAEADAACELIDFFRFNSFFLRQILEDQPNNLPAEYNRMEYRPLEGFVLAVTPFNFTAIGGNLASSPAMAGNTVVWKPASTSVYSNYLVMQLLQEAGLPDGVINFVPGPGRIVGPIALDHPRLAGIHFTGSTTVFNQMWGTVGQNIGRYRSYPRIVGETGGKDFAFVHKSADLDQLVPALLMGAYGYQGQKCSATSRAYIPQNLWPEVKKRLVEQIATIKMDDPANFTTYMGAVIDQPAFNSISGYLQYIRDADRAEIIAGGGCDARHGFFVEPTLAVTDDPLFKTMQEEIFGPVLTVYVYPDGDLDKAVALCESTSEYALTGSIFARERAAITRLERAFTNSAGNFYINDRTTGAVVGMQPFGGARASGTNEKAGSQMNLMRWLSPRCIKENFNAPTDYHLPLMQEK